MTDHENGRPTEVARAYDEATPVSVCIALAILELSDGDLDDLEFTLYEYVDPDALDSLVESGGDGCGLEVELVVENYDIRLVAGERVYVSERPD